VQAAHCDDGPAGRARGQRRVLVIAFTQPGQERRHVCRGDLADRRHGAAGKRRRVTLEVPVVGLQRVRGEAALDQQVVEVTADRFSDAGQFSTSAGAVHRRPWASATGRQVTVPPYVFSPRRSAGSAASAARQPRLAISSAYGSVTLVSA
jgi:hypothetical protein